jgi:inositol-1,4,5-trisphosphate 5-phosphatase
VDQKLPNEWARKEKFSRDFWPSFRWGRKGYLHTRWMLGKERRVVDLINIHLFHDESNLAFLDVSWSGFE